MKGTKAAIYCRVALAGDDIIETQEIRLIDFTKKMGYTGCTCYRDNGMPGTTLDRPGINRLLADIRAGKVDTVIVHSFDRIARGLVLLYEVMDMFEKHNVKVISLVDGTYRIPGLFEKIAKAGV